MCSRCLGAPLSLDRPTRAMPLDSGRRPTGPGLAQIRNQPPAIRHHAKRAAIPALEARADVASISGDTRTRRGRQVTLHGSRGQRNTDAQQSDRLDARALPMP